MNAVNSLSRDLAEAKLSAAVERANGWLVAAKPIILAMFTLEDINLSTATDSDRREARAILAKPERELREMIEGIRDSFMCDERSSYNGLTEVEEEAALAFDDALDAEVISVKVALKIVGDDL